MTDRQEIRREMRARRSALDPEEQQAASRAAAERLSGLPEFQQAEHIGAYLAVGGELGLDGIFEVAREQGKKIALPVLRGKHLDFLEYNADTPMHANRFGIPEPDPLHAPAIPARNLDLVLAPLVAFDTAGGRLGMGGGFYDRSFAFLNGENPPEKPRLVGMAYEFQRVDQLPTEPWDVPLHGIVTEAAWHAVNDHRDE